MALGDMFLVTVQQQLASQIIQNTFFYEESNTGIGDAASVLAVEFDATVMSVWKGRMSAQWSYIQTQVQKFYPTPPELPALAVANAGVGAIAADAVPLPGAVTLTKRTAYAGRKFRGRSFLAGVPLTYVTNSSVNGSGLTNIGIICGPLESQLTPGAWTFSPMLWHKATLTRDPITSIIVRTPLRAQRRREVGRGI